MSRKIGCTIGVVVIGAIVWASIDAKTPANNPTTSCPATAAPEGAELVGTISFQTGATHVTGSGSLKVNPTGNGTTWQVKGAAGVELSVELLEVDPPKGLSTKNDQPLRMTDFRNNGTKVTLVDTIQECALTLQAGNRRAYGGDGTVQVFTNR